MTIPTPLVDTLPAPARKKLNKLLHERAMFGLVFSYASLLRLGIDADQLKACIAAADDDEAKEEKKHLNDSISEIMSENLMASDKGSISVRGVDQFGIVRDLIYMQSKSASTISRTRAIELAPKFGISTSKAIEWLEAATTPGTPYVTVQCRKVRTKEE